MLLLARTGWVRLVGPIFSYDLIRTARRRSYLAIRLLYPVIIFVLLLIVAAIKSYLGDWQSQRSSADFCAMFFGIYMVFNLLAIFLLTPAYAAGALAEEKEHQTLDALLASDLRDREIVLGTYLARITKLGLIFLAPLPIFSFLQLIGGIEPLLILAGIAFTAVSVCSLAALSLFFSVRANKPRDAIIKTYMVTLAFVLVLTLAWSLLQSIPIWQDFPSTDSWKSPVTAMDVIRWINIGNPIVCWLELVRGIAFGSTFDKMLPGMLATYAAFHAGLILCCCLYAILYLRRIALGDQQELDSKRGQDLSLRFWLRSTWSHRVLLADRPMFWKEFLVERVRRPGIIRRLVMGLGLAMLLLPIVHLTYFFQGRIFSLEYLRRDELLNIWLRLLCMLLGCIALLQTLAAAATAISGERDKQTLEELLATPLTCRAIFFAKWLSAILRFGSTWIGLFALWCIGLWTGAVHVAAVLAFLLCWFSFAAFLASLGIWFSVVCRTTRRATAAAFLTFSVVFGGTMLCAYNLAEDYLPRYEAIGLIPPMTLLYVTFSPAEWSHWLVGEVAFRPLPYLLSLGFWGLASWGVYLAARSRFGVLTGRIEADAEILGPTILSEQTTGPETSPIRPLGPILDHLSFRVKRLVLMGIGLAPILLLVGYYAAITRRGEGELTTLLAVLDQNEPGWRTYSPPNEPIPVGSPLAETRAIMVSAEELMPEKWPDSDFQTLLYSTIPDQETLPADSLLTFSKHQQSALKALAELRKIWRDIEPSSREIWGLPTGGTPNLGANLTQLLVADIMVRIQEGRIDEALKMCGALTILGRALGNNSSTNELLSLWSQRHGGVDWAMRLISRALAQGEASDELLAKLQRHLEAEDHPALIDMVLRMERARLAKLLTARPTSRNSNRGPYNSDFLDWPVGTALGNGVPAIPGLEEVVFLSSLKSLDVQRGEILQFLSDCISGDSRSVSAPLPVRWIQYLTSQLDSIRLQLEYRAVHYACMRCQVRTMLVALALERYRLAHGNWPASLVELTPSYLKEIPLGQFDGKPVIYKRLKDGVVVYAVGADLVDRGGMFAHQSWHTGRIDIGVRLWDPAYRRQPPKPSKP